MLAMHMANELLSPAVAIATIVAAAVVVSAAARQAQKSLDTEKLPLMGVMGAFVFAAQMINFSLPGMPGTSGHLGGGVLLAILLGPGAAIVTMAGILIIQCLLFQDGGLLAIGCNILNMAAVPCLLGWGLYRMIVGNAATARPWRQYLAAWLACLAGVAGGAAVVPLEAFASGILQVPLKQFLAVMIGVHLLIGLIEGAITFAVIGYLRRVRPESLGLAPNPSASRVSRKFVLASVFLTALLLAGVASWFASSLPDGLGWAQEQLSKPGRPAVENQSPLVAKVDDLQKKSAPLPDYTVPAAANSHSQPADTQSSWANISGWGSLAGIIGTTVTAGVLFIASRLIRRRSAASSVHAAH